MKHKTLDDEFPYGSHGKIQSEFWLDQKEMQGQIWIIGMRALLLKDVIFFFFPQEHSRVFLSDVDILDQVEQHIQGKLKFKNILSFAEITLQSQLPWHWTRSLWG